MKKESKLMKYFILPFITVLAFATVNAQSALMPSVWNSNTTEKLVPNCTVRREYNDFTMQFTDNQVCFPKVVTVPVKSAPAAYTGYPGYSSSQYLLSSFGGGSYGNTSYYSNPYISYVPNKTNFVGYYNNNPYTTGSYGGYNVNALNYYLPSVSDYYNYYGYDDDGDDDYGYNDPTYFRYYADDTYSGDNNYYNNSGYGIDYGWNSNYGYINEDRNIDPYQSGYNLGSSMWGENGGYSSFYELDGGTSAYNHVD